MNRYIWIMLLLALPMGLFAQDTVKITGTVYDARTLQPLGDAQVSSFFAKKSEMTDSLGQFSISITHNKANLIVKKGSYFTQELKFSGRKKLNVYLVPSKTFLRAEGYTSLLGVQDENNRHGTSFLLNKKDFSAVGNSPEEGLHGRIPGVRVMSKSSMPGEGAAIHMRGIRSMAGENMPLIVVDGMPYLPGMEASGVVNGFSKNIFASVNMKEVNNITLLKGADATAYGALGSNGVLVIETEKATDLETKIEFSTVEGVSYFQKRVPLLQAKQSKSYLGDIGENKYENPQELVARLPFLLDDPDYLQNFKYNNETDWQEEIYTPAFVSENVLKIKGGDAVAKYMLTFGTQQNGGIIENTHLSKYMARFNTQVAFSKKLKANATASLNYGDHKLQEQGMERATNPLLTSFYQAPFLTVHKQAYNINGTVEELPFYNSVDDELQTSNPAAVVNDVKAGVRSYDVIVNFGLDYIYSQALRFGAMFGLYYSYDKEDIFIPGKNQKTIAFSGDSIVKNVVRSGIFENKNYYGNFNVAYNKQFQYIHDFNVTAGFQLLTQNSEYDRGWGSNTPTDFYTTLNKVTFNQSIGGNINKWRWMNAYANIGYNYNREFYLTGALSVDRSSSFGSNSAGWFFFPSVKGAWHMKENSFLQNVDLLSELTLRAEYGINGNSRFSSRYGKYGYLAEPYRITSGIYRDGLPNSKIEPEKVLNSNIGVDFALVGDRLRVQVDLYQEQTRNMLLANTQPAIYGFDYRYENAGELNTKGIEVSLGANLINHKDWNWYLGATLTHHKTEITKLGNEPERLISFSDGAQLLVKEGCSPYLFYGNKAEKVFYSNAEAREAGYRAHNGTTFNGGDIRFTDVNNDNVINDQDRVVLGDPTPDFYGAFYTNLIYKKWGLFMNFSYSYGNEIYNAVRRSTGAMKDFSNQDLSVAHRWMVDGQETNVPRATYGDPAGNSRFSSRWIEDGSYLRLKEVTLSYTMTDRAWIFNALRVYLTGENLFCFTDYLGMDPEFSYSYDPQLYGMDLGKMPLAKTVKLGLVLNF